MSNPFALGSCFAPVGIDNAPPYTCNESKQVIDHNDECVTQCNEGYSPDAATLACTNTILNPATYECQPNNCTAPQGINFAPPVSCIQGFIVPHLGFCTAYCLPPYCCSGWCTLYCNLGVYSPPSFDCVPCAETTTTTTSTTSGRPCPILTNVTNAPTYQPCANIIPPNNMVGWYHNCTPSCIPGYAPNVNAIWCIGSNGGFTPYNWTCVPAPDCNQANGTIPNAPNETDNRCQEGFSVKHQETCQPLCNVNYRANPASLSCWNGTFTPSTYVCDEIVYVPPSVGPTTTTAEPDTTLSAIVGMSLGGLIGGVAGVGFVALIVYTCTKRRGKGGKPVTNPKQKSHTSKWQYSSFMARRQRGRGRM